MTKEPIIRMVLEKDNIRTFYKGKELKGIPDAFDLITDPEHAKLYMKEYRKLSKHADANVGYMAGYYSSKKIVELQERFGVSHPVFGRKIPTAAEALQKGRSAKRR